MKLIGIILIIIGLLISIVTGFNFTTQEKVVDIGKIQIQEKNDHQINWPPITGIFLMTIGGVIYAIGRRKGIKS